MFRSGLSLSELANHFEVSASTIALELDRLGERKQVRKSDLDIGFEKMNQHKDFFFVLGMVWGIGTSLGNRFVIRHQSPEFIGKAYDVLRLSHITKPFWNSGKYCIQFSLSHPFAKFLFDSGWIGRKSSGRDLPTCDLDMESFVCGYVYAHHSLKWSKNKRRKQPYLRLRIFGPTLIIEEISSSLSEWTGVGQKNLYSHTGSDKMVTIEYTMREEVDILCTFLGLKIQNKEE